ncbi:hypothetical protein [Flavobacterium myungsuense]|jgi:hypothetical protein|uniref:Hydrolase n=2 Tax=Flavobacterium myungsuense TaxID=651823 RepID=A0ABW3J4T6_9FLAO
MKKSFFLYLLILAVLMNIFTYMYYSKKATSEETRFKVSNAKLRDSLNTVTSKLNDANYFSLENNENAQNYFDNANAEKFIAYEKLIPFVKEKLMDANENPAGNPYIGMDKIGEQKFIINKVKILNHRWIIADYSDGDYWGEALIKYFINDDETVSFENFQTLLYQK